MTLDADRGLHAVEGKGVDPIAYDQYIGRWSRLFVPALLDAARVGIGQRVLDVATGTGEAAQAALLRTGPSGIVVGADVSEAMIACARQRVSGPFVPLVMDAQSLAFEDGSFDSVICQLGLMFIPEPGRALAEFRRVLRPGGRVAVCVIAESSKAPMWGFLAESLGRQLPQRRRDLALSFSLAAEGHLRSLLEQAEFAQIEITRESRSDTLQSLDEYWAPIETGVGLMPRIYRSLAPGARQTVREEVTTQLLRFEQKGKLTLSVEMLIGTGCA